VLDDFWTTRTLDRPTGALRRKRSWPAEWLGNLGESQTINPHTAWTLCGQRQEELAARMQALQAPLCPPCAPRPPPPRPPAVERELDEAVAG